jgi:hypothetical protein
LSKAKAKNKTCHRQKKGKLLKRGLPRYAWVIIALAVAGIVIAVRLYPPDQCPRDALAHPRAAIVDQLSILQENPAFIAEVTRELEGQGFEVDLYQGEQITVDFYRKLPTHCYRVIVFRTHSGILEEGEQVHLKTTMFTNEEFDWKKHQADVWHDRLFMAGIDDTRPRVFSIAPKFIRESMQGSFDDTVIIMMGCAGIYLPDLAEAFMARGASAYLAWDASVLLDYVDGATEHLVKQLCSEKATVGEAVASTMAARGPDPRYEAELQYYPQGIGGKTLADLTRFQA